jgi:hypothetical protein
MSRYFLFGPARLHAAQRAPIATSERPPVLTIPQVSSNDERYSDHDGHAPPPARQARCDRTVVFFFQAHQYLRMPYARLCYRGGSAHWKSGSSEMCGTSSSRTNCVAKPQPGQGGNEACRGSHRSGAFTQSWWSGRHKPETGTVAPLGKGTSSRFSLGFCDTVAFSQNYLQKSEMSQREVRQVARQGISLKTGRHGG